MKTATIINFDLAAIARRIKDNFTGEQADEAQVLTLAERKQARRKAIAEDLALVQANPPPEGFQAWVKANCPFNVWTAYDYLKQYVKITYSPDDPATPPRKSKGGRPKGSTKPKAKAKPPLMGWSEALDTAWQRAYACPLPAGFARNTTRRGAPRQQLIDACGEPPFDLGSRNHQVDLNNPDHVAWIDRGVAYIYDETQGKREAEQDNDDKDNAQNTDTEKLWGEFEVQISDLPLKYQKPIRSTITAARHALDTELERRVVAAVVTERKRLIDLGNAAEQERQELQKLQQTALKHYDAWISKDEHRFVLNCLHPDRAPEDRKERFGRAFDIVRRLEQHIHYSVNKQQNGWNAKEK